MLLIQARNQLSANVYKALSKNFIVTKSTVKSTLNVLKAEEDPMSKVLYSALSKVKVK